MSNIQEKFELILYWEAKNSRYATKRKIHREVFQYLLQKEKISQVRDIKELKKTFVGNFVVLPEDISDNSAKISLFIDMAVPKTWLESKDLYEANKDLISSEVFNDSSRKNLELSFMVYDNELAYKEHTVVAVMF